MTQFKTQFRYKESLRDWVSLFLWDSRDNTRYPEKWIWEKNLMGKLDNEGQSISLQHYTSLAGRPESAASLRWRTHRHVALSPYPSCWLHGYQLRSNWTWPHSPLRALDHCQTRSPAVLQSRGSGGWKMNALKCMHLATTLTNSPQAGYFLSAELAVLEDCRACLWL